jgi:hypothetical protein
LIKGRISVSPKSFFKEQGSLTKGVLAKGVRNNKPWFAVFFSFLV